MLHFDAATLGTPFQHPWRNAIAVGRAFDLTRADLQRHLADVQQRFAYKFCRFHAIFDDDMAVVVAKADGNLAYQWRTIDLVYDFLLSIGLKPFVELNATPKLLASGNQDMFHYKMNVTPPKDPLAWEALVEAFTRHLVDRYGIDEVRSWYFEVWNEPNLAGFWSGTQADYWTLYDASARAVKRVDAAIRIGGPATSKANWIAEMIDHSDTTGVPLDFISTHLYPQDEHVAYPDPAANPHKRGEFFLDTVRDVQRIVADKRPGLEIHWTEWNAMSCRDAKSVDWIFNTTNDSLYGAAFVVRNCIALDDACDTFCWWVASDVFAEAGIPVTPYSMTYGMVTIHGIPKASCRGFEALQQLRGPRMAVTASGDHPRPLGAAFAGTKEGNVIRVVLANQDILDTPQGEWTDTVQVAVAPGEYQIISKRVRVGAGSAYETWLAMGGPQTLTPADESLLLAHSEPEQVVTLMTADAKGLRLPVLLRVNEVVVLDIRPRGEPSLPRGVSAGALAKWNAGMGALSR